MILDHTGTEFRSGRIIKPRDWIFRKTTEWWEHQGDKTHYKIVARSKGGLLLWQGVFNDFTDAVYFWHQLITGAVLSRDWDLPTPSWSPGYNVPGVTYEMATVVTYTSGSATWTAPANVIATDYLLVAGGGGGGGCNSSAAYGGAGGAGGVVSGTGATVVPGTGYAVSVGAGGNAVAANLSSVGGNGVNSTFAPVTSAVGGGGGAYTLFNGYIYQSWNGSAGGSGGGTGFYNNGSVAGGAGTAGQGNAGGNSPSGGAGSGGGGKGSAGTGAAGSGQAYSITGSSVTYATGGSTGTGATGANNTGNGGGGAPNNTSLPSGYGGTGIVVLSFTPVPFSGGFNMPMLGM